MHLYRHQKLISKTGYWTQGVLSSTLDESFFSSTMFEKSTPQENRSDVGKIELLAGQNQVQFMLKIVNILKEKRAVEIMWLGRAHVFSRQNAIDWFNSVQSRGLSATLLRIQPGENIGRTFAKAHAHDASVVLEITEITIPPTASPIDALAQMIDAVVYKTSSSYIEGVAVNASMHGRNMFLTDIEITERLNQAINQGRP